MMTALHPVLRQLAEASLASGAPRIDQLSLEDARAFGPVWAAQLGGEGPSVERVEDVAIAVRHGSIPGRLYVPAGRLKSLIAFFHGGGWVLGDIASYDSVARMIANEAGCAVLMVEYRLAPEFPFPAGLEDCFNAAVWASENGAALVGQLLPLVVMGDSAGGNLAAVVAQLARARNSSIAAQILVVPNTDADPTTASFREVWDSPLFGGRSMEWFWSRYQPDPDARQVPEISPLRAKSLDGLPPAIVVTTEHDPLRDEGDAYALAMRAAGVRVTHYRLESLSHGFLNMMGLFDAPHRTARQIGRDLEAILAGGTPPDRTFSSLPASGECTDDD